MDELDADKQQVAVHIADYDAMMTRVTWFMNLQYLSGTLWIGFLAFAVSSQKSYDPVLFIWGVLGVSQVAVIIYCFALYEAYNHVRYIHTNLKPEVARLLQLGAERFWGYEAYLKKVGKAYNPGVGDLAPVVISAIVLIVAAAIRVRVGWTLWDSVGSVINIVLFYLTVYSTIRIVRTRTDFETSLLERN